ncbi:MAG: MltA domain-containing protein, partial [Phycisphaerales bacterium]
MPKTLAGLADAFENKSDQLTQAMDRSLAWFDHASSKRYFPWEYPPITHLQARRSLVAIRELITGATNASDFVHQLTAQFDIYESIGYDGKGTVFFTAYFAPEYPARRHPNAEFRYPLYELPSDLARKYVAEGRWPNRLDFERDDLLAGHELVWLNDPLNVYLIHVNGSACLRLGDQDQMYVGYTATNEHKYTSLGKLLVAEGLLSAEEVSMQTIRDAFERTPTTVGELMLRNARFVFFKEYGVDQWPLASLGVPLTAGASLATDKTVYPPGGLVLVRTPTVDETGGPTWTGRF